MPRWLVPALVALGLLLTAALAALPLLFLSMPAGWIPVFGFAPGVGAAWAPGWPLPLPRLTLAPTEFRALALALQALGWGSYGGACWLVHRATRGPGDSGRMLHLVIAGTVLAHLVLVLTPPTMSKDLYHYALFGRMLVTQGLNPYVHPGDVLAGDPLWQLANWRDLTTHYGPVFTGLSALAAWLGGGGVIGTALAFKTLSAASSLTVLWAVWRLAAAQGRAPALRALVLLAWNPLVVLESAGSGHNDPVMLAPALLGLVLVRAEATAGGRLFTRSGWAGFLLLLLSVHVKWVTAAVAGLVALDRVRAAGGFGARAARAGALLGSAVLVTALLYLPFWALGAGGLGSTVQLLVEGERMRTHATGVVPASVSPRQLVAGLAFLGAVVAAMVMVWRRGQAQLLEAAALVSVTFVVAVFAWVFPWYLLPALVFLAVGPRTRFNRASLVLLLAGVVTLSMGWATLAPGVSR